MYIVYENCVMQMFQKVSLRKFVIEPQKESNVKLDLKFFLNSPHFLDMFLKICVAVRKRNNNRLLEKIWANEEIIAKTKDYLESKNQLNCKTNIEKLEDRQNQILTNYYYFFSYDKKLLIQS